MNLRRVFKTGNSAAITIPLHMLEENGITIGGRISLESYRDAGIWIRPHIDQAKTDEENTDGNNDVL